MSAPDFILWYDLETNGTDEHSGLLLEFGGILTDRALDPVSEFSTVVHWDNPWAIRASAPPVVQEMHDRNGLWSEVGDPAHPSLGEADRIICGWLSGHHRSSRHIPGAGSGVSHFDRRWVDRHLPKLSKRLTYWSLDVGVLRRTLALAGVEPRAKPDDKPHRALDDTRLHLEEMRGYVALLRGAAA